jgi:C4-dicarboxylate-specific signal transduction histidine kinase
MGQKGKRKPPSGGRKDRKREVNLYHDDRLAALGMLAAGIAHELNQPLNTIRVVTDGFLYGRSQGWATDPEELFEGLEMISQQVTRMDKVIRNVRNFARDESGAPAEGTAVMVNEAVENVFSMIGRQIEAHGIRVERDLEPDLPPVKAPPNELEQVVMNLIVNARQALDEGACTPKTLRVCTGLRDSAVWIEVSDNGGGIPVDLLERIFEPFFTTKAAGKGTGLGLSICESIVSKFGGRIEAANNDRGGATFLVFLPVGKEAV